MAPDGCSVKGYSRERKPGVYELIVAAGRDPVTGKYRQVSRTIRTTSKRAVDKALRDLIAEVEDAKHAGADLTVAELLRRYIADCEDRDRSPATVAAYEGRVRVYLGPAVGKMSIAKLRASDLESLYAKMRSDGLSNRTVGHTHGLMTYALNFAVRMDWLPAVDADRIKNGVKLEEVKSREMHPPTTLEVGRLIALAQERDPDFAVLLRVGAATSARRGEICALRWSDFVDETCKVTISRSVAVDRNRRAVDQDRAKTEASRRVVTLDPQTCAALKAWRWTVEERAGELGQTVAPDAFIFSRAVDHSTPLQPTFHVTAPFGRLADRLGLKVRFHDLRHYGATMLLDAGMPVAEVSNRLGHANTTTTLNIYAHSAEGRDREAAAMMGKLLDG